MFPEPKTANHQGRMKSPGSPSVWEILGVLAAIALGYHFLALRIYGGDLLTGDEGSWSSVASEIAKGNGFITRWLEMPYLLPYTLPRPDDYRYPALASLLALSFKGWGYSLETARWTVAGIFLLFSLATWSLCRFAYGRWVAMATLWLTLSSLLQLEWNSSVYTEGLFGLGVTGLAAWCLWGERSLWSERYLWSEGSVQKKNSFGIRSLYWWIILGIGIGFLYLVRVNAILFLPGVVLLYWTRRKTPLTWLHPAVCVLAFCLVAAPWLIRMQIYFGNPFHFAGSGELLREPGQSNTLTVFQYFSGHKIFFPLERIVVGFFHYFPTLNFFEHGLEIAPLLLALIAILLRRPFFNPFLAAGFLLTFTACCYSAYNSWGGLRYMSSLLPLVYAYGLSIIPEAWTSKKTVFVLGILLLWLPVLYPHRFYERKFSKRIAAQGVYPYRPGLAEHLSKLQHQLPQGGHYYAASLCNENFLLPDRYCIGLQDLYDPTWFSRSREAFRPSLVVLTHAETQQAKMLKAIEKMRSEGYTPDSLESGEVAVYYTLRADTTGNVKLP